MSNCLLCNDNQRCGRAADGGNERMNNKVTEKEANKKVSYRKVCVCVYLPASVRSVSHCERDGSGRRDELD